MMNATPTTPVTPATAPAVTLGDTVIVKIRNDRLDRRYVVINVARVWITVRPEGETREGRDRRFRLDDQTDGNRDFPTRFYTLAQWEAIELEGRAVTFLHEQGINIRHGGPWHRRAVELADVIATHLAAKDGA